MKEKTLSSFLLSLVSLLKSMSFFSVCKTSLPQPLHRTKIYILGNNDLLMNYWLSASSCILKTELERQDTYKHFIGLLFSFLFNAFIWKLLICLNLPCWQKFYTRQLLFIVAAHHVVAALFDGKWDAPSCKLSINISELFNFLLIV